MTSKMIYTCDRCKFETEYSNKQFMREIRWYDGGDHYVHLCKLCYKHFKEFVAGNKLVVNKKEK